MGTVVELAISQAQARLEMQFRNADALDAKAFGLLGADAAALAVLVATHSSLGEVWWLPATGLGLSALLLLAGVKPRELDQGPNIRIFFEQFGGEAYDMAALQMLGEVLSAVERNEARMPRRLRVKWDERHATLTTFKLGFMLLVGSLIGAFVVGIAR